MIFCNIGTSSLRPLGFTPFYHRGIHCQKDVIAKNTANILICKSIGLREVRAQRQQDGVRARFPTRLLQPSTHLTNYRSTFPQKVGEEVGLNKQENFQTTESAR